ncbi:MAG: hypothetical protein JKY12_09675, partial [Sneathiella sp.]|nr:hypothetical protein [Sneathiella sp.]
MSGIKSTSGGTPANVDSFKGATATHGEVAPISPSSPSGGQSGNAVPKTSSVSALSEGTTIPAIVTARAKGGDTMLHAEIGNFRMSANSQLPVGSYIVLEVETIDDVIIARIISINGEKLAAPPSVTLLPTVPATNATDKGYIQSGKTPSPEIQTGLQNLTAALGKVVLPTPSKGIENAGNILTNFQPDPAPLQKPALSSNFFPAQINVQNAQGPNAGRPQSLGTAAYAHTHSPGQKPSLALSMQNSVTGTEATKLILSDVSDNTRFLVKVTIQRPPLSQSIELPSGRMNLGVGSSMTAVISSSTNPIEKLTNGVSINGTVFAVSRPSQPGMKPHIHVQTETAGTISYSMANAPQIGTKLSIALLENMQQFPLQAQPP